LPSFDSPDLGVEGDRSFTGNGLRVQRITKRSPAERAGIRAGDVVTKINDALVANIDDFKSAAANLPTDSPVRMTVQRSSGMFEFQVR
jgi:putative serine protease PepD